jgi:hypothetical protein
MPAYSPTFLKRDPVTGLNYYDFDGHIHAAGLDLQAATLISIPEFLPVDNRIAWADYGPFLGQLAARIWAVGGGAGQLILSADKRVKARAEITGGGIERTILADDGTSDYQWKMQHWGSNRFSGPWDLSTKWSMTPNRDGNYLCMFSGTAYAPSAGHNIHCDVRVTGGAYGGAPGTYLGSCAVFANEGGSHKACSTLFTGITCTSGITYSFNYGNGGNPGDTASDTNDFGSIGIVGPFN